MIYLLNSIQDDNKHVLVDIIDRFENDKHIPYDVYDPNEDFNLKCYLRDRGYCRLKLNDINITIVVDDGKFYKYSTLSEKKYHRIYVNQIHKLLRINNVKHILA